MSNEFNLILSQDLSEVSGPIMRMLIEQDNYNLLGIGALLQLASCMMAERISASPSLADHEVAAQAFKALGDNHKALVSVIAQVAKAFILVHHGYGEK